MKSLPSYPYNLLDDIFEEPYRGIIDSDIQAGIDYAVSKLREREILFIKQYYIDGLTLDEMVTANSLTRERIRQIIIKAVRKLRHPSLLFYINRGYTVASGVLKGQVELRYSEIIKALEAEYTEKVHELRDKITAVNSCLDGNEICAETPEQILTSIDTPLFELDLSVRSYNVLTRAGVKTLGDICSKSFNELSELRNMGRKSIDEIRAKVGSMGYKLRDDTK